MIRVIPVFRYTSKTIYQWMGSQDMLKLSFENEDAVISLSKSDCSIGMVRFFCAKNGLRWLYRKKCKFFLKLKHIEEYQSFSTYIELKLTRNNHLITEKILTYKNNYVTMQSDVGCIFLSTVTWPNLGDISCNRQSSIVNRQSSIVNRQSSIVNRQK